MRAVSSSFVFALLVGMFCDNPSEAGDLPKGLQGISVGGLYYLSYISGEESGASSYDKFGVTRAYLTVKKADITPFLSSRITLDAHLDESGDMKVRLKYLYADFHLGDLWFITAPHIELGMVHMPWLDFEEHINYYRMRGKMFSERNELYNSADMGFTVGGYLGGEMDEEYRKRVNSQYAGRYGSFAFGVYNGGGYHSPEQNLNKVAELRLTLRPLPDMPPLQGVQLSYFGIFGQGNKRTDIPDWRTNVMMLSFEHRWVTVTGQYLIGSGNQKGTMADSLNYSGYSLFGEGKWGPHWRAIVSYDFLDRDVDAEHNASTRMILGVGYDFGHRNILILDYDVQSFEQPGLEESWEYKLTMQIHF